MRTIQGNNFSMDVPDLVVYTGDVGFISAYGGAVRLVVNVNGITAVVPYVQGEARIDIIPLLRNFEREILANITAEFEDNTTETIPVLFYVLQGKTFAGRTHHAEGVVFGEGFEYHPPTDGTLTLPDGTAHRVRADDVSRLNTECYGVARFDADIMARLPFFQRVNFEGASLHAIMQDNSEIGFTYTNGNWVCYTAPHVGEVLTTSAAFSPEDSDFSQIINNLGYAPLTVGMEQFNAVIISITIGFESPLYYDSPWFDDGRHGWGKLDNILYNANGATISFRYDGGGSYTYTVSGGHISLVSLLSGVTGLKMRADELNMLYFNDLDNGVAFCDSRYIRLRPSLTTAGVYVVETISGQSVEGYNLTVYIGGAITERTNSHGSFTHNGTTYYVGPVWSLTFANAARRGFFAHGNLIASVGSGSVVGNLPRVEWLRCAFLDGGALEWPGQQVSVSLNNPNFGPFAELFDYLDAGVFDPQYVGVYMNWRKADFFDENSMHADGQNVEFMRGDLLHGGDYVTGYSFEIRPLCDYGEDTCRIFFYNADGVQRVVSGRVVSHVTAAEATSLAMLEPFNTINAIPYGFAQLNENVSVAVLDVPKDFYLEDIALQQRLFIENYFTSMECELLTKEIVRDEATRDFVLTFRILA